MEEGELKEEKKHDMKIITSRPEGMPYDQYRMILKIQEKVLKHKKKGSLIWLSKIEATPGVLKYLYENNMMESLGSLLKKGTSFKGSTKDLKHD